MDAAPPQSPAAVVRAWSRDLNANRNAAAARLFADEARVIQAPVFEARVLAMLTEAYTAASGSDQASTDPASGPGAALQR